MTSGHVGLAQSVMTPLNAHAKRSKVPTHYVLARYAVERFLYRLSLSSDGSRFVLKGATLMTLWLGDAGRPTRDVDLAGFGDLSDESLHSLFESLSTMQVADDAIAFDPASIKVASIRTNDEYGGRRVTLVGRIGRTRAPLQVDIGIGDAISPPPSLVELPVLLGFPPPRLRAYRPETSIAEKLHAMVTLGIANTRIKDYYDIDRLAMELPFVSRILREAIERTFGSRGIPLPSDVPDGLSDEFSSDEGKRVLWKNFTTRLGLVVHDDLGEVVARIRQFLMPVIRQGTDASWPPGGPWQSG